MAFLKGLFHRPEDGRTTFFGRIVNAAGGLVGVGNVINDRPDLGTGGINGGIMTPSNYNPYFNATQPVVQAGATTGGNVINDLSKSVSDWIYNITHPELKMGVNDDQFNWVKVGLIGIGGILIYKFFIKK